MARRNWLHAAVLVVCGILAAATVPQAVAQSKIPVDPKLLTAPPEGAIVLFGGKAEEMRNNWYARHGKDPAAWKVDDKGVATPNHRDITSKQEFGDCYLHVEFCEPMTSGGNSGVGMQGRYEVQILNSYGKKPEAHECGAFYSQTPPKVIASKPAGEWQTYDIFFRAPRFDDGKLVEKARITVYQNGALLHENAPIQGPTGIQYGEFKGEVAKGPSSCRATTTRCCSAMCGSCPRSIEHVSKFELDEFCTGRATAKRLNPIAQGCARTLGWRQQHFPHPEGVRHKSHPFGVPRRHGTQSPRGALRDPGL